MDGQINSSCVCTFVWGSILTYVYVCEHVPRESAERLKARQTSVVRDSEA